jgi:glycosyltransferase involved in cell wall biosynthesis
MTRARQNPGRLFLAVSPSNIPVVAVEARHAEHWRKLHGIGMARWVMGYFGTIGGGKRFDWVVAAWRRMRAQEASTALVVVGSQARLEITAEESPWLVSLGHVEAKVVSEALQALDLLLVPFVDGVSERRSSFMAGLAHGLAVITTVGPSTGEELRAGDFFLGVPLGDHNVFAATVADFLPQSPARLELGARARRQYAARYSWDRLADELTSRLKRERSETRIRRDE